MNWWGGAAGELVGGRLIFDVQQLGLLSSNARFLAEARHCHLVEPKQDEYVVLGLTKWGGGKTVLVVIVVVL